MKLLRRRLIVLVVFNWQVQLVLVDVLESYIGCVAHAQHLLLFVLRLLLLLGVVQLLGGLLLLESLVVLDLLGEQRQVLRHLRQVLHILCLGLCVLVHIVLSQFLIDFAFLIIHECIQLFDVDLTFGEVNIGVK